MIIKKKKKICTTKYVCHDFFFFYGNNNKKWETISVGPGRRQMGIRIFYGLEKERE